MLAQKPPGLTIDRCSCYVYVVPLKLSKLFYGSPVTLECVCRMLISLAIVVGALLSGGEGGGGRGGGGGGSNTPLGTGIGYGGVGGHLLTGDSTESCPRICRGAENSLPLSDS